VRSGSDVHDRLKAGGLVVVMRHMKDISVDEPERNCEQPSRVLGEPTTDGHKQALKIRSVLQNLQIPIGSVFYSPTCRTIDTAQLVFGEVNPENEKPELKINSDPSWLLQRLAEVPVKGNEVLVTHSEVLSAITLQERKLIDGSSKYGLAAIFDPKKVGSSGWLLGCLEPDQWKRLARRSE